MSSAEQTPFRLSDMLDNSQESLVTWANDHLLDWVVAYQGLGLVLIAMVALFLARLMRRALEPWVEKTEDGTPARRLAETATSQSFAIVFLIPVWLAVGILVQMDLEEKNDFLEIVASLMTAWVLIKLTSSVITNSLLASFIFVLAWSAAALNILGLLDPLIDTLELVDIPIGDADDKVTLLSLLQGIVLLFLLLWIAFSVSRLLLDRLEDRSDISPRAHVLLGKMIRIVMIVLAVLIALSTVGVDLTSLAVFAGALGVGIGIGLQHQASNLISGLFLLLDRSIKPGDVIEVGETFGWVRNMHARYVGVVTRDNKELLIPNDDFVMNQVINWSHSDHDVRMEIMFHVSYESDPHLVQRIAIEAAASADIRIVESRRPLCHLKKFGDSSIDFVLRFWINDPQGGVTNIKGKVLMALWDKLREHDIEIPYPHRQLILPVTDRPASDRADD